ncbi:MAG: gamma-glutamyl-gamma-aminobutyrate hydrolase family protein [Clostridia bacterium]|nr:gamma-glutamyl-gamma-aminobutyrate hydrolase family protein [Clostridia bacterium]
MKKPVIAVAPLWDEEKQSLWMLPHYFDGVTNAGGIPVMLPLTDDEPALHQLLDQADGLLLTGGQDVDPALYHQPPHEKLGQLCPLRDRMETILLRLALERDMPVLGICRGLQFINAALGGTLYQDLPSQHPSPACHRQQAPYHHPAHSVALTAGSPLQQLLKKNTLPVNSLHHQAVCDLAPCLAEMARADDGLVEAAFFPGKRFVWGVQWHPEFYAGHSEDMNKIFAAFTAACAAD